jgi:hypothetical protein
MKPNVLIIPALFLLSIMPLASATNTYEFTGYRGTPYNIGTDYGLAFNYSGSCQIQMSTTTTYTIGASYISHVEWFSPIYSAALGTADVTYTSSSSCRTSGGTSLQSVSKDSTTGIYENKVAFSPLSATGGFSQTKTRYSCNANGGKWVNITVTPENTSHGDCQWIVSDTIKFQQAIVNDFFAGFNSCGTADYTNEFPTGVCGHFTSYVGSGGLANPNNGTVMYAFPFNSTGGYIIYHFAIPGKYNPSYDHFLGSPYASLSYVIQLINLNTGQSQLISNESYTCPGLFCTYTITGATQGINYGLEINTPYAFLVSYYGIGSYAPNFMQINSMPPVLNLSILAEQPDLVCTPYTACINGSQSRLCHDNKGLIPDRNEFQQCFSFANQQLFLGFDSGYTAYSWYCSPSFYNIFTSLCGRPPELRQRRIPNGWYRNGQFVTDITARSGWVQDYVDVDLADYYGPDQSTNEGSLKLWFIPRKLFLPVYNGTGTGQVVCMNTSEGQVGGMQYYVNDTFWISRNITALSPFITISYRAKKCPMTVDQTKYFIGCTLGCELFGNCGNSGLCANTTKIPGTSSSAFGDDYYTGDGCPQIPSPSTLGVEIENLDTGEIIQSYLKTIDAANWLLGYQEDNINNMNISAVYKLSFAAYPSGGLNTNDGNCVMIDDVNVNFRDAATPCTSGCSQNADYNGDGINDYTYIEATRLSLSSCTVKVRTLDPRCTPAAISQDAQAMQQGTLNCTCDNTTQICINPTTQEYSFNRNNPTCIARSQQQAQQQGSSTPISLVEGFRSTLEPLGLGFLLFWGTPMLITFIIIAVIGSIVIWKTKHWEPGALIMLALIIIFAMPPMSIFPIWIPIIIGVLVALLIGESLVKKAKGGGG